MTTSGNQRDSLTAELKTKQICRFCLTQVIDELSNIYTKDSPLKSLVPLPVEIMAVASVEVFLSDGMPSTVCSKCRLTFDYCYRFKQMCKKAESLLRQVPLIGEWPKPLSKPCIPLQLLAKPAALDHQVKLPTQQSTSQSQLQCSNITIAKTLSKSESTPKKILNSNPASSPEPPIPVRLKKDKGGHTKCFRTKVENNEQIFIDDTERLIASEIAELTTHQPELNEVIPTTSIVITPRKKPKVLNKSSIRILNKEAEVDVEPRLRHPQVKHDEDGNVSIVTEILDPNEPYEAEPDPVKTAVPIKTNVFPCPYCERSFPLLQLRDIHVVNHTRERHYQCTECERSFFSKYDLQKHTVIHTGERKYICSVCKKGFTRSVLLHRHEKIHTDMPKYLCVFCEKSFLSKDDMEKHVERHRKNRPFKCKVCSKAFAFKQGLDRHEVVHSSEQPYPCQYCDQSFCTPSKLSRHLVAHAGKRPFPCKFCPKSYLMSHHLSRHVRSHKDGVVMYSCYECDKVYKTCDDLILHSAVHASATLTCPLCQQAFENVELVTAHVKKHANAESFACEFCDLIFLTYKEQNDHVRKTHAEDLAAYREDDKKSKRANKHNKDDKLEQTIEDFLYDELPMEDNEFHITTHGSEGLENATSQLNEYKTKSSNGEEYHKVEELIVDNEIKSENKTETESTENHEPVAKKYKIGGTTKVTKPIVTHNVEIIGPMTRRTAKGNSNVVKEMSLSTLPKGLTIHRTVPTLANVSGSVTSTSTSSSETTQIMLNFSENSSTQSPKVATAMKSSGGAVLATEKRATGEKRIKVQKIVVTKAQAAAMAKEGHIRIKDGNLIFTPKSSK